LPMHLIIIFHACLSLALIPFQHEYFLVTPFLYIVQPFPFWSSSFCFLFHLPEHHLLYTSLLSSTLQICPNKFNFLSLFLCKMFLLLLILFLFLEFSSLVIFCCHLTFTILRYSISSQMPSVCSCLFSSTSTFHMRIQR